MYRLRNYWLYVNILSEFCHQIDCFPLWYRLETQRLYNDRLGCRMKLLIVEDEIKTSKFLKRGFGEAGFVVSIAPDGTDGLRQIKPAHST